MSSSDKFSWTFLLSNRCNCYPHQISTNRCPYLDVFWNGKNLVESMITNYSTFTSSKKKTSSGKKQMWKELIHNQMRAQTVLPHCHTDFSLSPQNIKPWPCFEWSHRPVSSHHIFLCSWIPQQQLGLWSSQRSLEYTSRNYEYVWTLQSLPSCSYVHSQDLVSMWLASAERPGVPAISFSASLGRQGDSTSWALKRLANPGGGSLLPVRSRQRIRSAPR